MICFLRAVTELQKQRKTGHGKRLRISALKIPTGGGRDAHGDLHDGDVPSTLESKNGLRAMGLAPSRRFTAKP